MRNTCGHPPAPARRHGSSGVSPIMAADPTDMAHGLTRQNLHGIYNTDSDGEFYAIELDEFKRIVDVFADETQRLGFPTVVDVTWSSTKVHLGPSSACRRPRDPGCPRRPPLLHADDA